MDVEDYLQTVELVDCHGSVTHRLTLLVEGSVRVRAGHVEAVIDPTSRNVAPPNRQLGRGEYSHAQIVEIACSMLAG